MRTAFLWALATSLLAQVFLADVGITLCLIVAGTSFAGLVLSIRHLDSRASAVTFMLIAPITAAFYLMAAINFATAAPEPLPSGISAAVATDLQSVARAHFDDGVLYILLASGVLFGLMLPYHYYRTFVRRSTVP